MLDRPIAAPDSAVAPDQRVAGRSAFDPALADRFAAIVGDAHAHRSDADRAAFDAEQRRALPGRSALVLRPANTGEVAAIVRLAAETRTPIVPQGGNTGLVGAGVARGDRSAAIGEATGAGLDVVVALGRMNAIRDIDPAGNTMVAEAGCVLQGVQEAADAADRLFPLALGSQGSAQIGGLIGSNAGGMGALAYGVTRDLVMGLEAVTPDGRVWNGLTRLKKNNTGYDLKQLMIGGEGTLGIVTAAVLKLFPRPKGREIAFAGMASPAAALTLLGTMRERAGGDLTLFELIERTPLAMAIRHFGHREPLEGIHPTYALVEVSSGRSAEDARAVLEEGLGAALEAGTIGDAAIAGSLAQAAEFRAMRENCSWAQREEGASIKHDIALPVAAIPDFLARAAPLVEREAPGSRVVCFGHMGDGNLHYNVSRPVGGSNEDHLARCTSVNEAVFGLVMGMGGSISAEHGIGQAKRAWLPRIKGEVEMDMMRAVKRALDPHGIMNPGKLL